MSETIKLTSGVLDEHSLRTLISISLGDSGFAESSRFGVVILQKRSTINALLDTAPLINARNLIWICSKRGLADSDLKAKDAVFRLIQGAFQRGWIAMEVALPAFDSRKPFEAELGIPSSFTPCAAVLLGYPDEPLKRTSRKAPEILSWIK